ncbi:hypothetical protein BGAL_0079g00210 [Botrytis galanthina]|uniref:Uncharacterized protein n=1 Tax=Botrytis galanthina TaxID=278940 RepID=A0A4S8R818_9HELO|nr:hypothetical protein BGAL_0079g00210 [Botrytis galanthina]
MTSKLAVIVGQDLEFWTEKKLQVLELWFGIEIWEDLEEPQLWRDDSRSPAFFKQDLPDTRKVSMSYKTPRIQDRSFDSCGAKFGGKFKQKDENTVNERTFYISHSDSKPVAATELQGSSNAAKYPM